MSQRTQPCTQCAAIRAVRAAKEIECLLTSLLTVSTIEVSRRPSGCTKQKLLVHRTSVLPHRLTRANHDSVPSRIIPKGQYVAATQEQVQESKWPVDLDSYLGDYEICALGFRMLRVRTGSPRMACVILANVMASTNRGRF